MGHRTHRRPELVATAARRACASLAAWAAFTATAAADDAPRTGLEQEPTVAAVQRAVAARERRLTQRESARAVRWSHLLPERLSVRVARDDEDDWTGTVYDDSGWRRKRTLGSRVTWRIEAQWDLSRLVYDPNRLAVQKRADDVRRRRDGAVDLATRLYFERRKLQLEYVAIEGDPAAAARLWTAIAELTARLDVMCDGLFSRQGVRWW